MKTVSIFSIAGLVGTLAFAAGLALNLGALPLFAATTAALALLTWIGDYRTRPDLAACTSIALRRCQALPLAA